jgi:eukaryotic-like serine/threonine-protein kinase
MHEDGTLGTADYIAPEQVMDSHDVDIRADIYSLGATFYFLLTGWPPFDGLPIADKLMAHQMKQPRPISDYRSDVPAGVLAIIGKMTAKSADQRYATPADLADALAPFTQTAVPAPPAAEMPVLCPAASGDPDSAATAAAQRASSGSLGRPLAGAPLVPAPPDTVKTAAVQASSVAAPIEEAAPWEQFADDTDHAAALAETPAARGSNKSSKTAKASSSNKVYTALLVLGFCVIPACLVGGAVGFFVVKDWISPPKSNVQEKKGPRKFEVSKDPNRKKAFHSIQAALKEAEIDSIIELWDDTYDENVVIDGSKGGRTAFTLQAAAGKDIVWKAGRNDPETPILRIIKAPDFKFKGAGIILDGTLDKNRKVNDLMMITSDCMGLVIEDVQFRDFGRDAILVMNAAGAAEKPIILRGLWTFKNPAEKPRAAIYFDANPKVIPAKNSHITIDQSCKFNSHAPADAIRFNAKLDVFGDGVRWPDK